METPPAMTGLPGHKRPALWTRPWFLFCLAALIAISVIHGPSVRLTFLSDDYDWITRAEENIQSGHVFQPLYSKIGGNFYRPLPALTFTLDSAIAGRNVVIYHVHQLIILYALVLSLAWLLWLMFKRWSIVAPTALLFAAYPAHHEVVTWLAGRPDLLATLWMVLSAATLIKYCTSGHGRWFWLIVVSTALAFLSKESALALPAVHFGILAWLKIRQRDLPWRRLVFALLPSVVLITLLLVVRGFILTDSIGGYRLGGQNIGLNISARSLVAPVTSLAVLVNLPYWRDLAGQHQIVNQVITHIQQLRLGLMALGLLIIILGVWRRHSRRWLEPLALGALWAFVTFIPVLGLTNAIGSNLEGSRLFFAPSIGYCLIIISFMGIIFPTDKSKTWYWVMSGLLVAGFGSLSLFNLGPWQKASRVVTNITTKLTQNQIALLPENITDAVVSGLPGKTDGAYEFWGPHITQALIAQAAGRPVNGYVAGANRFSDSPFCTTDLDRHIGVLRWNSGKNQWERLTALEQQIATTRANPTAPPVLTWAPSNLGQAITSVGPKYTIINNSSWLSSTFPPISGANVRGIKIELDSSDNTAAFGSRRATMEWAVDNYFADGLTLSFTIPKGQTSFTIPLCEYTNWSLSDRITGLRLRPQQSGSFTVKSITLLTEPK